MSIYGGPDIVTSGLVLCLDAANSKSYGGSGTTWKDLSTNNNNGTLTNGPTYSSANGGSIVFDGTNDYIDLGYKTSLQPSTITLSAWFNSGSGGVSFQAIAELPKYLWVSYALHISSSSLSWRIGYTDSLPYAVSAVSNVNYKNNTWYNVVGTYNKQNLYLYMNGMLVASYPFTSDILYNPTSFQIGYHYEPTTYFQGNIANVSLYNRALSLSEVLQNYNATKGRYGL